MARKWTDQELFDIAKNCGSRREMRESYPSATLLIYRRKLADIAFSHMEKERQYTKDGSLERTCTMCHASKPISLFYKTSNGGLRSHCKACCDNKSAKWRKENPERSRQIVNKSARSKPSEVRRRANLKRKNNPHVAAARDMLKRVLSLTGKKKSTSTEKIIGYTFIELRRHIESKFIEGMTWGNWGEWHIDHIEPVSDMVKRGVNDPAEINALSNLRPLWAYENMSRKRK